VEVQAEQPDGSHRPEVWRAVLCACGTGARTGRTVAAAWDMERQKWRVG